MIPGGVYFGESTILRRSLMRGSTTEVINRFLDAAVIEANNRQRSREQGIVRREGLIMISK